jgi:hypothetical protein
VADLELQKQEEEAIFQAFTDEKIKLEESYEKAKAIIEARITDDLFKQNNKRIEDLKRVELQAIATARALQSA